MFILALKEIIQKEQPQFQDAVSTEGIMDSKIRGPKEGMVAVQSKHALVALESLGDYISSRMDTKFNYTLLAGPNMDGCYWYRYRSKDVSQYDCGESQEEINNKKELSKSVGLPAEDEVPAGEKNVQRYINYMARRTSPSVNDGNHILVAKHFPGGDVKIESTEFRRNIVFEENLSELTNGYLEPFLSIMGSSFPPQAIMTSHARYPNVDEDISLLHPDIAQTSILPPSANPSETDKLNPEYTIPATFSPYILKGLLRRELNYDGAIISDWANMESLDRFLDAFQNLFDKDLKLMNRKTAQKIVLSVDAGVNYLLGMVYQENGLRLPPKDIVDLQNYAQKHPEWLAKLDEIIDFNLNWCKKTLNSLCELDVPSAKELSVEDKVNFYLGFSIKDKRLEPFVRKINSNSLTDLWNRQGILTLMTRTLYLEQAIGSQFPMIWDYPSSAAWLGALSGEKKFWEEYNKVDWTCAQSEVAWKTALEETRSKELAKK